MTDTRMARLLARTYDRRLWAFRPRTEGGEKAVYSAVPCALSRTARTAAPAPMGERAALAESRYAMTLYTRPQVWLRLGDRLEISDTDGRVYHARSGDSMVYPSHCVTVVEVLEVRLPEEAVQPPDAPEADRT